MRKILLSILTVGLVGVAVFAGTKAFFSDTETSQDNLFQSGAIDLKVDSQCFYSNGMQGDGEVAALVSQECGDWEMKDLQPTSDKFFNFSDLKPGDYGENTISLHTVNNDARACLNIYNVHDDDVDLTEPETEDSDTTVGFDNGEISSAIQFMAWDDDGDNIWEAGEAPLANGTLHDVINGTSVDLGTLTGSTTKYLGFAWCFGNMSYGPDQILECDGQPVNNLTQTDKLTADISFYVEQTRNNPNFSCDQHIPSSDTRLLLENKDAQWNPIVDDRYGVLSFKSSSPKFDYNVNVYDLNPNTLYAIHYYKDPWPSTGGIIIDTFTTDASGNYSGGNSVELSTSLPTDASDGNWPKAKIWIVPRSDLNNDGSMNAWHQPELLFESNLVNYTDTGI